MFNGADVNLAEFLIDKSASELSGHEAEQHKYRELERLQGMLRYARGGACRRQYILDYFEDKERIVCGNCDVFCCQEGAKAASDDEATHRAQNAFVRGPLARAFRSHQNRATRPRRQRSAGDVAISAEFPVCSSELSEKEGHVFAQRARNFGLYADDERGISSTVAITEAGMAVMRDEARAMLRGIVAKK